MVQFSHFDQLFPNVLPIILQIFHIILAKSAKNTKYETKIEIYILQHDRRFDIVIYTSGLSLK